MKVCLFLKKNEGKGGLYALFHFFQIPPSGPFLQSEKSPFSPFEPKFQLFMHNGTQITPRQKIWKFCSTMICPNNQ